MNYVQSNYGAGSPVTSVNVVLSTVVAVGDLIVVCTRISDASPGTVSDNLGNTYTVLTNHGGQTGFYMYRCIVTAGGSCTVTASQTSSGRLGAAAHHYSNADAAPLDQETDVNSGTATSAATDAVTTGVSDGVVVGMWGGSVTPTPEADYGGANLQGNSTGRLYTCHRLFTSTLTGETVDWTHASATFQVKASSFKTAAGAGPETFAGADSVSLTEAIVKGVQTIKAETITLTETFTKSVIKAFTETVSLTESFVKQFNRSMAETVALAEARLLTVGKLFTDAVGLTESLSATIVRPIAGADTVTFTENLQTSVIDGPNGLPPQRVSIALRLGMG